MRAEVDSLVLEVTRRCNMTCPHCLRGDAEAVDLDIKHVDSIFSKLRYINSITFTGGEPSLVPRIISKVIDTAKRRKVEIGDFYIATNAKQAPDAFLAAIVKVFSYCSADDEISAVEWSNDEWHENNPEAIRRLQAFSFAHAKYTEAYKPEYRHLIAEGRGFYMGGERENSKEAFVIEDGRIVEGTLYLNCEGNIIAGCDWSYESQREPEKIICKVENFSLEEVEAFNIRE